MNRDKAPFNAIIEDDNELLSRATEFECKK